MDDFFSNRKIFLIINAIAIVLLCFAFARNPYDYYRIMRILLSFILIIDVICLLKKDAFLLLTIIVYQVRCGSIERGCKADSVFKRFESCTKERVNSKPPCTNFERALGLCK